MNTLRFALRSLARSLQSGELNVLIAAIVLAVAAITAVGFFTDRVGRAIRQQASAILAADLVIRSPTPIASAFLDEARALGLRTAEAVGFPSVVLTDGDQGSLATIEGVSPGYPLRGEMRISTQMFGGATVAKAIPASGEAWAEPGLLGKLGIDVGARVQVGKLQLTVTRVLEYQPDQNPGFANLAPSLLVNIADVVAMDVIRPGSRVTYRQLFAGDEAALAAFRRAAGPRLDREAVFRDQQDAGQQINEAIDRAQRFLTLASLITVVLAAVATAMAARLYAMRHLDTVALLKSIGATQGFIERLSMLQLGVIVLATTAAGSLIGFGAQQVLALLSGGLLQVDLPPPRFLPAWLGALTAATVAFGFALPQLWQLRRTPPIRVLRRDLPAPPLSAGMTYAIAVAALVGMIYAIVRDLVLVGLIVGGLLALAAVAGLAGWGLVALVGRFRGAAGVAWRYGLANIARRGPESVVQIVGFGLGLMVLLLLTVVRTDLLGAWRQAIPADAPNYFLINIDPPSWPAMREFIQQQIGSKPESLPFIRGRLTAINGRDVATLELRDGPGANFIRREQNLTWTAELPQSNRIRSGQWWGAGYRGEPQISLEQDVARSLGVKVGDTMSFNVAGEEFTAPVTSIRSIEWDSFAPNFFLMLSPGLAAELPQTYIASFHVPPESRRMLNDLVRRFPGVTVFDLEAILSQVRLVVDRASLAVQYVFLFTLLAGVMVLLAAVQVTRDERRFESAILHALGADRRKILQGVAAEFTTLGALAGVLAALGATAIGLVLAEQVFDLGYTVSPLLWPAGLLIGAVLVGLTGTLAARRAVNEPPVAVLRDA
ncbi:FtsX-like permease family protein [Gammaproteobacteria bacterium PRO2]|nr:FtsX-like permease family protein [Gammaproteobacteria bacterium PRO2]